MSPLEKLARNFFSGLMRGCRSHVPWVRQCISRQVRGVFRDMFCRGSCCFCTLCTKGHSGSWCAKMFSDRSADAVCMLPGLNNAYPVSVVACSEIFFSSVVWLLFDFSDGEIVHCAQKTTRKVGAKKSFRIDPQMSDSCCLG